MPAATSTLTGDLSALVVGQEIKPEHITARLVTNLPPGEPIIDKSTGGALHFGPWPLTLDAAGKFTQTGIIRTGTADTNPSSFQYIVEVLYYDATRGGARNPLRWTSTPFSLTAATADLHTLMGEQYAPPVWQPVSKAYVDAADAAISAAIGAHVTNPTGAHAASAVSFAPASGIAATNAQAAIVEAKADADLARELTNAAEIGKPAIVADALVIDVTTKWGIDGNGSPYFDDAGPTAGQEAVMYVHDGELSWTALSLIR